MIFKALDPDMPDDEVEQIISEVDEDGSGTVDYEGQNARTDDNGQYVSSISFRILQANDRLN
jgi:hypothetical protein